MLATKKVGKGKKTFFKLFSTSVIQKYSLIIKSPSRGLNPKVNNIFKYSHPIQIPKQNGPLLTIHLKTYVNDRYKITTYYNQEYGELFDLHEDPSEVNNLWNNQSFANLKANLIQELLFAEMGNEPLLMPRVAGA